jgi:pimeloyl-ACP methyl ester carboxylesterase
VCFNALHGLGVETRAAEGLKGGVAHLVNMVGYALQEGRSTVGKLKEFGNIDTMDLIFDVAEDQTIIPRDPRLLFGLRGPGIDEAEIEVYTKSLCRWHGKTMFQPLECAAWREIPVTYIHAKADISVSPPEQQSMVEELGKTSRKVKTFTIESGHCPNLTAVQGVVDAVNRVASS